MKPSPTPPIAHLTKRLHVTLVQIFVMPVALGITAGCSKDTKPTPTNVPIVGAWTGTAGDGTEVLYVFAKEGTVVWKVNEKNFLSEFPNGVRANYEVRVGKPYWEIDIFDFDEAQFKGVIWQGILEVSTQRSSFTMEGTPSTKGRRPQKFSREAVEFQRTR